MGIKHFIAGVDMAAKLGEVVGKLQSHIQVLRALTSK